MEGVEEITTSQVSVSNPSNPHDLKSGDAVGYIPHKIHALKPDAEGEYPWRIGRLTQDGKHVEELTGSDLELFLAAMKRYAKHVSQQALGQEETDATRGIARQIIFIAPNKAWKATVRNVNNDGTVDLDVHGASSCVTLHERRVKADYTKQEPHTFHKL